MNSRINYDPRNRQYTTGAYSPVVEDKWESVKMPLWVTETIACIGMIGIIVGILALAAMCVAPINP